MNILKGESHRVACLLSSLHPSGWFSPENPAAVCWSPCLTSPTSSLLLRPRVWETLRGRGVGSELMRVSHDHAQTHWGPASLTDCSHAHDHLCFPLGGNFISILLILSLNPIFDARLHVCVIVCCVLQVKKINEFTIIIINRNRANVAWCDLMHANIYVCALHSQVKAALSRLCACSKFCVKTQWRIKPMQNIKYASFDPLNPLVMNPNDAALQLLWWQCIYFSNFAFSHFLYPSFYI